MDININRSKRKNKKRAAEFYRYDREVLPWGQKDGPWAGEPDFFKSLHKGLIVSVMRDPGKGTLSGMIGIHSGHSLFDGDLEEVFIPSNLPQIKISEWHGEDGLFRNPQDPNRFLWDESGSKTRWVGFSMDGVHDVIPLAHDGDGGGRKYRMFKDVVDDCLSIAEIIVSLEPGFDDEDISQEDRERMFEWWD